MLIYSETLADSVLRFFFYKSAKAKAVFILMMTFASIAPGQQPANRIVRGSVVDARAMPVTGASVRLIPTQGETTSCKSNGDGRFACLSAAAGRLELEVVAAGFATFRTSIEGSNNGDMTIVLEARNVREEVVVTANRDETRIGDTPASVTTISRTELSTSSGVALDDTLRQVAGFSIFRRSSSRTSNPTTQGVSLRGVGASGASRTLVLDDGVPLNDPFGGWVQWARLPPISVERVEILRGGASSLYGDASLSGAVNLLRRKPLAETTFAAEVFGDSQSTFSASVFAGRQYKEWTFDAAAAGFQTKGYIPVDQAVRGPVDVFSGSRNSSFSARVERKFRSFGSLFFKPGHFGEVRTNGTGMQTNRTHIRQFAVGGHLERPNRKFTGNWWIYGGTQVFDQVFSAINAPRTAESLSRVQRSPAYNLGFSGQISTYIGPHTFVGGVEGRSVRGSSDEIGFTGGIVTTVVGAGGKEQIIGAFVQDLIKIGEKAVLAGSLRFDTWSNSRGYSATHTITSGQIASSQFPDRNESALSPQVSFLYRLSGKVSIHASASRSFRSPTLNELYRAFRVGNVLTLANAGLTAERADNLEAGVSIARGRTYFRASGFWTRINGAIANVTLTLTPNLITRNRQNAGRTLSRGLEAEAETTIRSVTFSAGYQFVDSRNTRFPANPAIVGLRIPQVARHQLTFRAHWSPDKWIFSSQARATGNQYDDDLNLFRLEPYIQLDMFASRVLTDKLRAFVAIENLFNSRYSIGKTPVRTVSSPITVRLGLRWN